MRENRRILLEMARQGKRACRNSRRAPRGWKKPLSRVALVEVVEERVKVDDEGLARLSVQTACEPDGEDGYEDITDEVMMEVNEVDRNEMQLFGNDGTLTDTTVEENDNLGATLIENCPTITDNTTNDDGDEPPTTIPWVASPEHDPYYWESYHAYKRPQVNETPRRDPPKHRFFGSILGAIETSLCISVFVVGSIASAVMDPQAAFTPRGRKA
ncbi:hypothetical protein HDU67_005956 [Dinochytrium kinnereticum]|nr:hypothetical protein HDU67_005956 [Dinochytrium kinnereticum]